uniref:cellulase n=1 Tax=Oryza brachyantha TaxID=4533 RepID=J3MT42_ORYBR
MARGITTAMLVCAAVVVVLLLLLLLPPTMAAGGGVGGGKGFDYRKALQSGLLYFEAQRSGHLPYNQRVRWRGHSGLADGLQQGVDLVGGYYDAGDNVKFGLPMAFTVTMLSWSAIEFAAEIAAAGERRHVLEAIKWGIDYLVKAHTAADELWAEVGDGDTDHYCWQRPEDMTTSRQAYKVDRHNPGSDVAGETAAALAAASIVFRRSNPHYSHLLLHHAEQLFDFGDKYRGKYDSSIGEPAAMADEFGGTGWAITEFSWDVKYAGLQILAAKVLMDGKYPEQHRATLEQYRSKAEHYLCACLGKNAAAGDNVNRTAGGLLFVRQWNNMQYVTNAAFLLTGYDDWFRRGGANPNVVVGAIVGGPDHRDRFVDRRDNYMQTEACTYNTAPMVGVFAHLHSESDDRHCRK